MIRSTTPRHRSYRSQPQPGRHQRSRIRTAMALLVALSACGGGENDEPEIPDFSDTAGAPAPGPAVTPDTAPPPAAGDTASDPGADPAPPDTVAGPWQESEARAPAPTQGQATLQAVRTARHDGYDRIVFEFTGGLPGYAVRYAAGPLQQCGSGRPVTVETPAALQIQLRSAAAHDDQGHATVEDRNRSPRLPVIRTARLTCDFEGEVEWVLEVEQRAPFRVLTLRDPARLVLDLRHR